MTKLQLLWLRFKMRPANLNKAIRKANKLHLQTGKRYRVFWLGWKYRAWCRDDIKRLQHDGNLKHGVKAGIDFDGVAFYDTDSKRKEAKHVSD